MKWLLHDLVFGNDEQPEFIECLKDKGHEYELVKTYSDLPEGDIVRCSINMAKYWYGHKGIICNWKKFLCSEYYGPFSDYLLNWPCSFTSYGEVSSIFDTYENNGHIFLRPDAGDKSFTGEVLNRQELEKHRGEYNNLWTNNLSVVIAKPYNIDREFRVVVIGDKAVSASQYKKRVISNLELEVERIPPTHGVYSWVDDMLKVVKYRPDPIFVIDVAEYNNRYYVLELNSFTCSGLYDCDPLPIIQGMQ